MPKRIVPLTALQITNAKAKEKSINFPMAAAFICLLLRAGENFGG